MDWLATVLPIEKIATVLGRIPSAVLTLGLSYVLIRIVQAGLAVSLKTARVTKPMHNITVQAVSVVLWIGALALMFQALGLNQIAIAISGSIAVVGIGLASGANKLVADIVAGLFLAKNRDFVIGAHIELPEAKGRIQSLDARKVRVLADDGTLFVVPNAKFDEQIWQLPKPKDQKP